MLQCQQRTTASQGCASLQLLLGCATAATLADPNLFHAVILLHAGSLACSHCWLLGRVTKGTRGTRSWVCHHALEDSSSVQAGAVLGVAQGRVRYALHSEVFT